MSEALIKQIEEKMLTSINHLVDDFATIRTGRANPSLVDKLNIEYYLHGKSSDIALGTDNFGAGDQGIMFGYANRETENYMPFAISYSHKILQELSNRRKSNSKYKGIILYL